MSAFEFILILETLIVGLAIAEILMGVARILRGEFEFAWLHFVWVLTAFVLEVQFVWSSWTLLGQVGEWGVLRYLLDLTGPVWLYLVAATLFPPPGAAPDLDQHLLGRGKLTFILVGLLMVIYSFQNVALFGGGELSGHLSRGLVALACAALLFIERTPLRWALSMIVFVVVVGYAVFLTPAVAMS